MDDVIGRCIAAFQPALDAKGIIKRIEAHADALVWLDPLVLEQILNNLISNVEKYAASGGGDSHQEHSTSRIEHHRGTRFWPRHCGC